MNKYLNKTKGDVARNTFSWQDQFKGEFLMYKLPGNIQYNDNVVVREDENLVFMRDGKILHIFDKPGRYALTTTNVPILGSLGAAVTGIRQLGEGYYVQRRELRGKFGTPEPMSFRDKDFGVVRIRMFGKFAYRLTDPTLFITQFVGTKGYANSAEVMDWLRDEVIQVMNDILGELKEKKGMGILDLPQYLQEIEQLLLSNIEPELNRYGLKVTNIAGLNFNLPEEVQKAIDKRGAMGALGVNYMQYQSGKALENISNQEGGGAGGFAGLGAGMGAGYGMASQMSQGMNQPAPGQQNPPPPMAG
ncbi:MAG: SPFH domain-containing protein, partial [Candidatus Thermoplasmatota archaeon]|nr:SPFH domain-containing protein [Candidatus Thermoplasmatota archaeon]